MAAISSSVVGKPSIPSASFFIALSESSADTPNDCKTFGNLFNVSKRLIAASIELFSVANTAEPIATNPNAVANFLTFSIARLDPFSTSFSPCSVALTPSPDLRPALSSLLSSLEAIPTCFPSTSIAIFIFPSAATVCHLLIQSMNSLQFSHSVFKFF